MSGLDDLARLPRLPHRPAAGHKNTFGMVIVVGGCETMPGAPALCAAAALRAGCGLVKVAAERVVLPTAIGIEPGATGVLLEGRAEPDLAAIDAADLEGRAVLAVGPGLGQHPHRAPALRTLITTLLDGRRTVVLDADGLNHYATVAKQRRGEGPLVLTPHPGEFRRLAAPLQLPHDPTDPDQRAPGAAALARHYRAVVVLKGQGTVVSDGDRTIVNPTGNPALATAGSGDVLTGLIAALIAQGMTPYDAAVLGVYAHGHAADAWAADFGPRGLTALTLAHRLPATLHTIDRAQNTEG